MSGPEEHVYSLLKEAFPYMKIQPQLFIKHRGHSLYVDFFIPELSLAIEVHGRQHTEFVAHFHRSYEGFKHYKDLDYVKAEWAYINDIYFLELYDKKLPQTTNELLSEIRKVMEV